MSIGSLLRRVKSSGRMTPTSNLSTATVLAPGASTPRSLAARTGDSPFVEDEGAVGDGATDDTAAIQSALTKHAGGRVSLRRGATYIVDPSTPLLVGAGTRIDGNGATLKVKAGTYPAHGAVLTTIASLSGTYSAGTAHKDGIEIVGLTIDGNMANVTADHAITGLHLYQVTNALVRDVRIFDLPGTTGEGYGVITWYSTRVRLENLNINRTDRQNIVIWETLDATVKDCTLTDSYTRDVLLVSTNTPPSYQASHAVVSGGKFTNSLGNGITETHVVRFSGQGSGVIADTEIVGHSSLDGIYITGLAAKSVTLAGKVKISGCAYGIQVAGDGAGLAKTYDFSGVEVVGCTNGVRVNSEGGTLVMRGAKITGTTTQPLYVAYINHATIEGSLFDGGSSNLFLRADADGLYNFTGNTVQGLTSANYSLIVGGATTDVVNVVGNSFRGNTANAISHGASGFVLGNTGANVVSTTAHVASNRSGAATARRVAPTFGASVAIDAALGNEYAITATNGSAFTIANPTNASTGQRITVRVANTSGGALGTATWETKFKMAAWTQPADGTSRAIDFQYDGTNWIEVSRTPADVPN